MLKEVEEKSQANLQQSLLVINRNKIESNDIVSDQNVKIQANEYNIKILRERFDTLQRFLDAQKSQEDKIQIVLDSFKDRIVTKFRMSTEDFVREQIAMSMNIKELQEKVERNHGLVKIADTTGRRIDAAQVVLKDRIYGMESDLMMARQSGRFAGRIDVIENDFEN